MQQVFGASVRARRAEVGITLNQLAQSSGVSSGALSRIERGTLNTSLQNAVAIASALGSELGDLLSSGKAVSITRQGEAQEFTDPDSGVRRRLLARPSPGAELVHYTLPGDSTTPEFAPHPARTVETFHVLTGTVTIIGEDRELAALSPGDTAQAPGDQRHRIKNPDNSEATLILLMSTPR